MSRLHEVAREHPEAFQNVRDRAGDQLQAVMDEVLEDVESP